MLNYKMFEDDLCHAHGERAGYEDKSHSTVEVIEWAVEKLHESRVVQA